MRTCILLLSFFAGVIAAAAIGQDNPSERAVAEIRKLGGKVTIDASQPNSPAAVMLTGSRDPAACLPYLKDVSNLRQCDL